MTQLDLFASRVDPIDRPRLSRQCAALLARLRHGSVTNAEIVREMGILNSTGRISDLRRAGYNVVGKRVSGGVWKYMLLRSENGDTNR